MFSARLNPADVQRATAMLDGVKNGLPRAMTRTLNNIASKGKTRIVDEVYQDVNLQKAYIRGKVFGPNDRAGNRATFTKQEAKVTAASRPYRLANYLKSTRTNLQDVAGRLRPLLEVKVKRGSSFIAMPNAFLIRLNLPPLDDGSDVYGMFIRTGGRIKHLYGPSVSQIMNRELDNATFTPELRDELRLQFYQGVRGVLAQYG